MKRLIFCLWFLVPALVSATDWYASTGGSGTTCSVGTPCSLATLLCQSGSCSYAIQPGDNAYLKTGTYTGAFKSNLNGTAQSPIRVKPDPAAARYSVIIDTNGNSASSPGLFIAGSYTWYYDLVIIDSNTSRQAVCTNPVGGAYGPHGLWIEGLTIKIIGFVTHDNQSDGVGFWKASTQGSEVYWLISYYNGDSHLDHGIYTQNLSGTGTKYLRDSVLFNNFGHGIHGHASTSGLFDNYVLTGNTSFENGSFGTVACPGGGRDILVGDTAANPDLENNVVFNHNGSSGPGSDLQMGDPTTGAVVNQTFKNNFIMANSVWNPGFTSAAVTGNDFCCSHDNLSSVTYPSNTYRGGSFPSSNQSSVRPSLYESGKCFITAMNWTLGASQSIDISGCNLPDGANFNVYYVPQILGAAVQSGTYSAASPSFSFTMNSGLSMPTPVGVGYQTPALRAPQFAVFEIEQTSGSTPTPTSTPTITSTPTRTPTLTPSNTVTPTPSFTPVSTSTPTTTASQTPTNTPTPNPSNLAFEAESCVITSPMRIVADSSASNGNYIDTTVSGAGTPANGGNALCTFAVPSTGLYYGWFLVWTPNASTDSFYAELDGEGVSASTHIVDAAEHTNCDSSFTEPKQWGSFWHWQRWDDRSQNCAGAVSPNVGFDRSTVNGSLVAGQQLTAGNHTIKLYGRDIGTRIDYVIFNLDPNFIPSGVPSSPTATPTPSICKKYIRCNGKAGYRYIPCSMSENKFQPCPWR